MLAGLTSAQNGLYQAGLAEFVTVDGVKDGLGRVFNGQSCVSCHDGPAVGGSSTTLATRIGTWTSGQYDNLLSVGGPTIQVDGIGPVPGTKVVFVGEVVPPQATIVAHRRTNPLFGLGLVDAVPDQTFLTLASMQHQAAPTLAGQPNLVRNLRTGQQVVGRFGWKVQAANLFDFAVQAYKDEIGVTTAGYTVPGSTNRSGQPIVFPFFAAMTAGSSRQEYPPQGNVALLQFDPDPSPNEPDDSDTIQFVNFMSLLAPLPQGPQTSQTQAGQVLFNQIGCAFCHVPTLTTGPSPVRRSRTGTFSLYSDFLLHDMGSLGDGTVAVQATGSQMRTAPLWGTARPARLPPRRSAATVTQAIQLHAGQGLPAQQFNALSPTVSCPRRAS